MRSLSSLLGFLTLSLHVVVPILGLVAIALLVRGAARRLGIAGCAVLLGTGIFQLFWIQVAPRLFRSLGAAGYATLSASVSIISALGLALVIAAVLVGW